MSIYLEALKRQEAPAESHASKHENTCAAVTPFFCDDRQRRLPQNLLCSSLAMPSSRSSTRVTSRYQPFPTMANRPMDSDEEVIMFDEAPRTTGRAKTKMAPNIRKMRSTGPHSPGDVIEISDDDEPTPLKPSISDLERKLEKLQQVRGRWSYTSA